MEIVASTRYFYNSYNDNILPDVVNGSLGIQFGGGRNLSQPSSPMLPLRQLPAQEGAAYDLRSRRVEPRIPKPTARSQPPRPFKRRRMIAEASQPDNSSDDSDAEIPPKRKRKLRKKQKTIVDVPDETEVNSDDPDNVFDRVNRNYVFKKRTRTFAKPTE